MHKRGMTLVELTIAMVLGSILVMVMTVQFVTNLRVTNAVKDRIAISQEASFAINHMNRVLKFARPNPTIGASSITANIEGGHLPEFTVQTQVIYAFNSAAKTFSYTVGAGSPVVIARGVSSFVPNFSTATNDFTITLATTKGTQTVTVDTIIHALPN